MSSPLTLKAATLEALRAKGTEVYGPHARLVSAVRVTQEGVAGLFSGQHFEGTFEMVAPTPVKAPGPAAHGFADLGGVAALLAQADAMDDELNTALLPEVSTRSEDFGKLMDTLGAEIINAAPAVPALLAAPGDLVLVAGTGESALSVARDMAAKVGGALYTSGLIEAEGLPAADAPHYVMEARAQGVLTGKAVIIAFGLGKPAWAATSAGTAAALRPDQAWLVVDARHKPADTAGWASPAALRLKPVGLAVIGAAETTTPSTVNALRIPVGWVDGAPSAMTTLTDPA